MVIKSKFLGLVVLMVMLGGIFFSSAMGWWNAGTNKEPALITSGEAAGKPNPADIRGSYLFNDISSAFGVPVADLKAAFRLPGDVDAANFQVKGLETLFAAEAAAGKEIGADAIRLFVADYTGLPFTITKDIYLPVEAVSLLKGRGNLTAEQIQYLEAHVVAGKASSTQVPAAGSPTPAPVKTELSTEAKVVGGSTTFQQLLDWGVPQTIVEKIIGGPLPEPSSVMKDYFTQKGLEFSSYKQELQKEVDKTK